MRRILPWIATASLAMTSPALGHEAQEPQTIVGPIDICEGDHCDTDARTCIDVLSYELDLDFTDRGDHWTGEMVIELAAQHDNVKRLELDVANCLTITGCSLRDGDQPAIKTNFRVAKERLVVSLAVPLKKGQQVFMVTQYKGDLKSRNKEGWASMRTPSGTLRFDSSLQYSGAHNLFPCKASFFHPSDKPKTSCMSLRLPGGLKVIGPGNPTKKVRHKDGSKTWKFDLTHPVPTWGLGFAFGPYEKQSFSWKGQNEKPLKIELYRLPEHREAFDRAAKKLPGILKHLESLFGPYPFPGERLAIVETLSVSSANATWVGAGSQFFKKFRSADGQSVSAHHPFGGAERILSHELGHAWWGNGLSVHSWRDSWIHESFATYGELMYVGASHGEETLQAAFDLLADSASPKSCLAMCGRAGRNAKTASSTALWFKGPWVLRSMQFEIGDDRKWFQSLADFQATNRFNTVSTQDLIVTLEEATGHSWDRFFDEWFEGTGQPSISGVVQTNEDSISVNVLNREDANSRFHVPIDLAWSELGELKTHRILLQPGKNEVSIPCSNPMDVQVHGLKHILGLHNIRVTPRSTVALPGWRK